MVFYPRDMRTFKNMIFRVVKEENLLLTSLCSGYGWVSLLESLSGQVVAEPSAEACVAGDTLEVFVSYRRPGIKVHFSCLGI